MNLQSARPTLNNAIFIFLLFLFIFPAFAYYNYIKQLQQNWDDLQLLSTVTSPHKGTCTERALVLSLLKSGFDSKSIFHDLYLQKDNGTYCQIDLVLVTKAGLIAIEVKKYSGQIYGDGNQKHWTQVLSYGRLKHSHYNPIIQNSKHIHNLRKAIYDKSVPIFNMIVFYGDFDFYQLDNIPQNVFITKANHAVQTINRIISINRFVYCKNFNQIIQTLCSAEKNGYNYNIICAHAKYVNSIKTQDSA